MGSKKLIVPIVDLAAVNAISVSAILGTLR